MRGVTILDMRSWFLLGLGALAILFLLAMEAIDMASRVEYIEHHFPRLLKWAERRPWHRFLLFIAIGLLVVDFVGVENRAVPEAPIFKFPAPSVPSVVITGTPKAPQQGTSSLCPNPARFTVKPITQQSKKSDMVYLATYGAEITIANPKGLEPTTTYNVFYTNSLSAMIQLMNPDGANPDGANPVVGGPSNTSSIPVATPVPKGTPVRFRVYANLPIQVRCIDAAVMRLKK